MTELMQKSDDREKEQNEVIKKLEMKIEDHKKTKKENKEKHNKLKAKI